MKRVLTLQSRHLCPRFPIASRKVLLWPNFFAHLRRPPGRKSPPLAFIVPKGHPWERLCFTRGFIEEPDIAPKDLVRGFARERDRGVLLHGFKEQVQRGSLLSQCRRHVVCVDGNEEVL